MAQDRSGHGRPGESRSGEEEVQDTEQEDQDTEQAEELVPIQRLSIRIQEYWWHLQTCCILTWSHPSVCLPNVFICKYIPFTYRCGHTLL